jgi:hypothetical protein
LLIEAASGRTEEFVKDTIELDPADLEAARYSAYRRDLRVHSKPTHGMIRLWRSD